MQRELLLVTLLASCSASAEESAAPSKFDISTAKPVVSTDWILEVDNRGQWRPSALSSDSTMMVLTSDKQLQFSGKKVTIWHRFEYKEPIEYLGKYYESFVERDQYDCDSLQNRTVFYNGYEKRNMKGEISGNRIDPDKAVWQAIIPGTMGEQMMEYACSLLPKKETKNDKQIGK